MRVTFLPRASRDIIPCICSIYYWCSVLQSTDTVSTLVISRPWIDTRSGYLAVVCIAGSGLILAASKIYDEITNGGVPSVTILHKCMPILHLSALSIHLISSQHERHGHATRALIITCHFLRDQFRAEPGDHISLVAATRYACCVTLDGQMMRCRFRSKCLTASESRLVATCTLLLPYGGQWESPGHGHDDRVFVSKSAVSS
ncbi:hypothetical protein F5Y18DRAFT_5352 [Xylariaceae sp. FL1019]|nr:hypothetical protein F5Y18DRAFT_5352 [Xylariaceae sp. FL1019]